MRLQGMSQHQLAQQAQVSQAFISMVMRGRRSARVTTAWRISSALGVSTEELFTARPFAFSSAIGEDGAAA
ncbi:helix-turn-helix domain-containing protein [Streptomyces sp. NPDC001667]